MAPGSEPIQPLGGRLRRVGEMLIGLSGSPVPTHLFQTQIGLPGVVELPLPDGRTAQASLVFVTTEYGEPVGLAAILRDITLLKNLEQMKNDFVNTVSHDLKSPIMAIAMTTELLMKTAPATGEEAYRERCRRILRSANQMTELVTDLLDLGKIEAGSRGRASRSTSSP